MYSKFNKLLKSGSGFSLVELVVVVVIIEILIAITVPLYQNTQQKSADEAHEDIKRIIGLKGLPCGKRNAGGWRSPGRRVESSPGKKLSCRMA